jgi:hypothetical protein
MSPIGVSRVPLGTADRGTTSVNDEPMLSVIIDMNNKPHGVLHRLTCMCRRARTRGFAVTSCVLGVVLSVPAFAQMDSRARTTDAPQVVAFAFDRTVIGAVRAYVPADVPAVESAPIPPTALEAGPLRPLVEAMLRQSPTFRQQCQRLVNPRLGSIVLRREMLRGARALTEVKPINGRLAATVRLGPGDDDVELIAHEIEHIIEQLDGVDLRAQAELPGTGVSLCSADRGSFETVRAIRAGLKVAHEFRQNGS